MQHSQKTPPENPLAQCFRIIREIRSEKLKDHQGRPITVQSSMLPAYIYFICDPVN